MTKTRKLNPDVFNKWIYDIIDDYNYRIEAYMGGAGSGKSYGACQKVLLKALNYKRRVLVVRKVSNTLKVSIWRLMLDLLIDCGIYDFCTINKSDLEIELPNGSIFLFKGLDDPEKIKSITGITDIIIEEATELIEDEFTQLNLRLRPKEAYPQIYLMFNPISKKNWVYNYFFVNKPDNNTRIIITTYKDNKFLTADYISELERLQLYFSTIFIYDIIWNVEIQNGIALYFSTIFIYDIIYYFVLFLNHQLYFSTIFIYDIIVGGNR